MNSARISSSTSLFLDFLRLTAAFGVVLGHLGNTGLAPSADQLRGYGEVFVTAFFVLSGYVIAATASKGNTDGISYVAARLARLWTVALPCLLLSFCLEWIG